MNAPDATSGKTPLPSQTSILPALLQSINAAGGGARPVEIYDEIADRLGVSARDRKRTIVAGNQTCVEFQRQVRWTRQTATLKGLIATERRGVWELTQKAKANLQNIVTGVVVTLFETDAGIVLWSNAEDAVAMLEDGLCNLIVTSPPYALCRPRSYGNESEREWVESMLRHLDQWRRVIATDGSIWINVGPTFVPGLPVQSLAVERLLLRTEEQLGLFRLQEFFVKTSGLGGSLEWIGKRRIRVKQNVEKLLWLSTNPFARADNRGVLVPYAPSTQRAFDRPETHAGRRRPSGHVFGKKSFVDRGGAIPTTLIVGHNSGGTSAYRKACRAAGLEPHPATMAESVAEFAIRMSSEKGDVVADLMSGSCTTGVVAQREGRHFVVGDRSKAFLETGRLRFESAGMRTRSRYQGGRA